MMTRDKQFRTRGHQTVFLLALPIFRGLTSVELGSVLERLGAVIRRYDKGVVISHEGMPAKYLLLVLSGRINFYDGALNGERHLISTVRAGELIGSALLADLSTNYVGMTCVAEACEVMLFRLDRIRQAMKEPKFGQFFENLFKIVAAKLVRERQKCAILSCKTLPEKN